MRASKNVSGRAVAPPPEQGTPYGGFVSCWRICYLTVFRAIRIKYVGHNQEFKHRINKTDLDSICISIPCHQPGYTDCKDPICCPSMVLSQHGGDFLRQPRKIALSRSLIKRSTTATYQVALKMHIVLSIIWNLNSSIVFCLIHSMSCSNYYLLKRMLDITCGNVLINLLCLSLITACTVVQAVV